MVRGATGSAASAPVSDFYLPSDSLYIAQLSEDVLSEEVRRRSRNFLLTGATGPPSSRDVVLPRASRCQTAPASIKDRKTEKCRQLHHVFVPCALVVGTKQLCG